MVLDPSPPPLRSTRRKRFLTTIFTYEKLTTKIKDMRIAAYENFHLYDTLLICELTPTRTIRESFPVRHVVQHTVVGIAQFQFFFIGIAQFLSFVMCDRAPLTYIYATFPTESNFLRLFAHYYIRLFAHYYIDGISVSRPNHTPNASLSTFYLCDTLRNTQILES